MLPVERLSVATEIVAMRTGFRIASVWLPPQSETVPNMPQAMDWYRNISAFLPGGRAMVVLPIAVMPTENGIGHIGEIAMSGNNIINSGASQTEFRAIGWPVDASASVAAAGIAGVPFAHNLASLNHITMVTAATAGYLGDLWVVRGSNSDMIYHTGSYTGQLAVVAIKGINSKSVSQTTLVVNAVGQLIPAASNTMPLAVAEADSAGHLGELYAVREAAGWRIMRSGSADISCRIAIVTLI